ncbi:hypothetical protein HUO13_35510 [Saccharopolyspora erythraea]|uniref:GNAT family N-acetyltransferase n=1 Tax=Saccharopolyspora erythraea TaxID=1836 RepID=UPI001BAA6852|nr:hypothetical protein [Saccharopolyspora erythraea]QUH05383.1 hypothetical protein HUO13_35510 [Saccharopolyspora erythraea]
MPTPQTVPELRRGLGRMATARSWGRGIWSRCVFAADEPSVRLFRAHGFEQWGRLPEMADLDGVVHDILFLGLRVGDRARG